MQQLTIRQRLRDATSSHHEALDQAIGTLDLSRAADYARFLRVQYEARLPIERWCARIPEALRPPLQINLVRADLTALGVSVPMSVSSRFDCPDAGALGVAWALGGSSLGNRAMLADLTKRGGAGLPTRFLADAAMPAFFKRLRPMLEQVPDNEAAIDAAIAGAGATFVRFAAVASRHLAAEAA